MVLCSGPRTAPSNSLGQDICDPSSWRPLSLSRYAPGHSFRVNSSHLLRGSNPTLLPPDSMSPGADPLDTLMTVSALQALSSPRLKSLTSLVIFTHLLLQHSLQLMGRKPSRTDFPGSLLSRKMYLCYLQRKASNRQGSRALGVGGEAGTHAVLGKSPLIAQKPALRCPH